MRTLILGGDGYLGWPMAMYLALKGEEVGVLDSGVKRIWEKEVGGGPLIPPPLLAERAKIFARQTGRHLRVYEGDLLDAAFVRGVLEDFSPDGVVHFAEQPSAPYSMIDFEHAAATQHNNVLGTLNLLFALRDVCPSAHLVKLGTMGEYGTPNIDIEEGFLEIEHKGRKDRLPFPKQPGSFYHLSKVHDSHNIQFACRTWGLCSTDLNQGVVYGIQTDETLIAPDLGTSFHYDAVFGTVLNRFCVQAVIGEALTVYGTGGQHRGFINVRDTLKCVELALRHPPAQGEYRVFNQFTEVFGVADLATRVQEASRELGISVKIRFVENPRVESEKHYYNPVHRRLEELGLKPTRLSDELLGSMLKFLGDRRHLVKREHLDPDVSWKGSLSATAAR
jgi:UDP-sulfoquinovose synthase